MGKQRFFDAREEKGKVVSGFLRPLTGDHITAKSAVLSGKSGREDLNLRPLEPHDFSARNLETSRYGSLGCPCEDVKCGVIEVPDYDSDVRRLTLKELAGHTASSLWLK